MIWREFASTFWAYLRKASAHVQKCRIDVHLFYGDEFQSGRRICRLLTLCVYKNAEGGEEYSRASTSQPVIPRKRATCHTGRLNERERESRSQFVRGEIPLSTRTSGKWYNITHGQWVQNTFRTTEWGRRPARSRPRAADSKKELIKLDSTKLEIQSISSFFLPLNYS